MSFDQLKHLLVKTEKDHRSNVFFCILVWSFFSGIEENIYILKTIQHRLDYEHFFAAKEVKKAGIE